MKYRKLTTEECEEIKKSIHKIGRSNTCKLFNISINRSYSIVGRPVRKKKKKKVKKRRIFTTEEFNLVKNLSQSGSSRKEIAKVLNTDDITIGRIRTKLGIQKKVEGLTDEKIEQIPKLKLSGLSYGQISRIVKVSKTTISSVMKKFNST